jgi:hypothetical protein
MGRNRPVGVFTGTYSLSDTTQPVEYSTATIWRFFKTFLGGMGSPTAYLYVPDPVSPLTFTTSTGFRITPGRLVFDGASSPRIMWWLPGWAPFDKWVKAAVIHDWLYDSNHRGKVLVSFRASTAIFAEAMRTLGVREIQITIVCYLINKFGRAIWDAPLPPS